LSSSAHPSSRIASPDTPAVSWRSPLVPPSIWILFGGSTRIFSQERATHTFV
jgi:hypothetical protein